MASYLLRLPASVVIVNPIFLPLFHHLSNPFRASGNAPKKNYETRTILSNGYLGSPIDEERSEMRYVMRIAEFSESSNL